MDIPSHPIEYSWQGWHVTLWREATRWGYVAAKGKLWLTGDVDGTKGQAQLIIASRLTHGY